MNPLLSLAIVLSLMFTSVVSAQDNSVAVARIDYSEVEGLIEDVVLSQPENKKLGERFKARRAKSEELQKKMQEAMMRGEKINPMEASLGMMGESRVDKKVEQLVIEKTVGDKYQIVFKSSYTSSLLYTKIAIDDITDLIRQELLRQLPKN